MSNEQSIRDELIGLRLASYSKIMSDGYPSGIIRSNEEAADILLASPVIRRIQAEALRDAADDWHEKHAGTRPVPYLFMVDRADAIERGETA